MPQTDCASAPEKAPIGIAQLPNLGPKSAAMLASIGIATLAQLRDFGAVATYANVRRVHAGVSLNLLYALVAALGDGNWKTVQRERKLELMLAVADYERTHHG